MEIWHNPRCSKSRQTLSLLREQGYEPEIVEYLKQPPSPARLQEVLTMLGLSAGDLIRKKDPQYKELDLRNFAGSEQQLIELMCEHPKLIERPIVIHQQQARLGRPPEQVQEIL